MQNRKYSLVNSLPHLMSYRALIATLLLVVISTSSAAARRERLLDSWRPLHYNISLSLDDQLTTITSAKTEITILSLKDSLSQVDLDFGELAVDSVTVSGEPAPFERSSGQLSVKLLKSAPRNSRVHIAVSYHGKPTDGLILTADKAGKPSAIGDNWPDRVHHWIPCLDHPSAKATVSFTVTAPAREIVVANGRLDRVSSATKATRTWTWTETAPIPPYCMIIAVGEFAKANASKPSVTPLSYYVPMPDKKFAMQGFSPAIPSLKFFSQTVAPYPYEKLALIVGATRFGGMENSSAIVFASSLFDPRPDSGSTSNVFKIREGIVEVVAHEIAHQWFGDSVTESTWADLWLSEGFATYFAGLFVQHYEGEQAFRRYMAKAAQTYFNYEKMNRTPIHDTETDDLFKLLNVNNYQKGAWVLHMLRMELGDDAFFRGIRTYYKVHQGATASSEDLRTALEKASGKTLKEFFARWVYGAGHPQYDLSWEWNRQTKKLKLVLNQTQTEAAFPNTLPVEILTPTGKRRIVLKPTGNQTVQEVKLDDAPTTINIDPDNTVLKDAGVTNKD
ncbi:MAG: M1 family metallopeptidase [Acidobacteriota bacterium]|nr:M1 family metallopeptidase [Acidobacteriota bacterium]